MKISQFDDELVKKVLALQEEIDALGKWFELFGSHYWNGEYYDIDGTHRLFPVIEETSPGEWELVRYEIR